MEKKEKIIEYFIHARVIFTISMVGVAIFFSPGLSFLFDYCSFEENLSFQKSNLLKITLSAVACNFLPPVGMHTIPLIGFLQK